MKKTNGDDRLTSEKQVIIDRYNGLRERLRGADLKDGAPRPSWYDGPQVTAVKPASGPRGSDVVLTGANLRNADIRVTFGGVEAKPPEAGLSGELVVHVPDAARSGYSELRIVSESGGSLYAGEFEVVERASQKTAR